jgi:AGZA family xanthine/uracil permease-like MFS transporter
MMTQARNIPWENPALAIPAFLMITLMPFTYSITNGVGAGLISYTVIQAALGRIREIPWLLWVITLIFTAYFAIDGIEQLMF